MPAESFEGAQTVWLNAAERIVRRPPVARSIRCRIIRASQAAFGRSACGESRIPVPTLRPTDAPKNRTVRGKRDGCRNGPSPCGPCYRDAAPPRAELYRRDLVGIVVAAGPRHRTRGPVGHDEKEPPPDRRDIRCGRSVRHRALHPVRAAHRAGPHIRRPSPASVCKAPYPLRTPARVGTSGPIPSRIPPLQPMCRTPRLTVAPVRASSSALKEQPPILSAFAAGRAENRKRTAVRLSGRMLRGNRWRSVETPQFAMLEISVPVFAERCHPCSGSYSLALPAGPVPYAAGGSSRTRAGRSPAEPGARRQKR